MLRENIHRQMQQMIQEIVVKNDHAPLDMMSRLRFEEFERQHVIDLRHLIQMIRSLEQRRNSLDPDTPRLSPSVRPITCIAFLDQNRTIMNDLSKHREFADDRINFRACPGSAIFK